LSCYGTANGTSRIRPFLRRHSTLSVEYQGSNVAAGRYVQDGTKVGDVISVDGVEGTIEELGYASITVRSEDGHLYRIPNRALLENVVRKRA
jgi:Mechanosensitive ion channel